MTGRAHWFVCFCFCLAGTELAWRSGDLSDLGLSPADAFSEECGQAGSAREVGSKTRERGRGGLSSKLERASRATRGVYWAGFVIFFLVVVADTCGFVLVRVMWGHCASCVSNINV